MWSTVRLSFRAHKGLISLNKYLLATNTVLELCPGQTGGLNGGFLPLKLPWPVGESQVQIPYWWV